jgi:Ca-activated chloride channel family protein
MLALALCLPMPQAHAQEAEGWWRRADQQAHARMLDGVAAYRRQQYDEAIDKFTGNPTAVGQYNLGNALAKAGRYDEAIAAYDRALKQQPGMQDAVANRAAVDAARKRKPPPGVQQQNPGRQPSKGQQGKQGDTQGQQQGQPPPQQPPASRPQDSQQQARADAAQRQRMQDALRKQQQAPQPAQGQPQPARKETAEQRERRIANQAQLQRVPDDPGALLRAKFRLEYERRQGRRP